jgi:hypothetical protein
VITPIINLLQVAQHRTRCEQQPYDSRSDLFYIRLVLLQWILGQPGACIYMGCVGQDKYHQSLHDAASEAGLTLSYQVHSEVQTGTCAVLITGSDR